MDLQTVPQDGRVVDQEPDRIPLLLDRPFLETLAGLPHGRPDVAGLVQFAAAGLHVADGGNGPYRFFPQFREPFLSAAKRGEPGRLGIQGDPA